MMTAQAELEKFLNRKSTLFQQALLNLLNAKYNGMGDVNDAIYDLARLMRDTLILSDLHGRRRTFIEFDHAEKAAQFSKLPDRNPIVMGIPFEEAVDDLLTREPRLVSGAKEAAKLYSEEHVFALARSANLKLTERVQQAILTTMREGKDAGMTGNELTRLAASESHEWTRAYSDTVYETNVSSAYTNGRFEQAKDPDVAQVIKAMEYVGVDDVSTRRGRLEDHGENHKAAFGLIAAVDDPIWNIAKPPSGFRCRCGVIFVSKYELERRGLLTANGGVVRYEPPGFSQFAPNPEFVRG